MVTIDRTGIFFNELLMNLTVIGNILTGIYFQKLHGCTEQIDASSEASDITDDEPYNEDPLCGFGVNKCLSQKCRTTSTPCREAVPSPNRSHIRMECDHTEHISQNIESNHIASGKSRLEALTKAVMFTNPDIKVDSTFTKPIDYVASYRTLVSKLKHPDCV